MTGRRAVRFFSAPAILTLVLGAGPLLGPVGLCAQTLDRADSLLATGDTAGAIATLERVIDANFRHAEARYRLGRVLWSRVPPNTKVSADRRRAEEQLRYATRFEPDSAKYWLALVEVLSRDDVSTARLLIPQYLERARQAAARHGAAAELADAEYWMARDDWKRYEHLANRYLFVGDAIAVDQAVLMNDWRDLETFLRRQVTPDPGDPGALSRLEAEEHLRTAVAVNPRHIDAAGLLVVLLGEEERWPEAYEVARTVTRQAPDSGRAWVLRGLALTRMGRWREAQRAFERALQRMSPEERAPYDNLAPLLKAVDQVSYAQMSSIEREQLGRLYWAVAQPLYLDGLNEARLEFMARLTYVEHRWRDPGGEFRGFESDRGIVYLRYGPPDVWATFGRGRVSQMRLAMDELVGDALSSMEYERNTILWAYRQPKLRFLFSLTPGSTHITFSGDFRAFYEEARDIFPVRYDNVPAVAEMDSVATQFVQFRNDSARGVTDVAAFGVVPVGHMIRETDLDEVDVTAAVIVKDALGYEVHRDVRTDRVAPRDTLHMERRSWRFALSPSEYLMRVEARVPVADRSARGSSVITVRGFGGSALQVSDLLVAERVAPRDSAFERWTDFLIAPSAGRFAPGSPVGLLWEIYNLLPDSAGLTRYEVALRVTVTEFERRQFVAQIIGGISDAIGLSALGDDRVMIEYDREEPGRAGGTQVEYLVLDLANDQAATYEIVVTITDLVTGQTATASRNIQVTKTPLTR